MQLDHLRSSRPYASAASFTARQESIHHAYFPSREYLCLIVYCREKVGKRFYQMASAKEASNHLIIALYRADILCIYTNGFCTHLIYTMFICTIWTLIFRC